MGHLGAMGAARAAQRELTLRRRGLANAGAPVGHAASGRLSYYNHQRESPAGVKTGPGPGDCRAPPLGGRFIN